MREGCSLKLLGPMLFLPVNRQHSGIYFIPCIWSMPRHLVTALVDMIVDQRHPTDTGQLASSLHTVV